MTGWRAVHAVMEAAGLSGPQAVVDACYTSQRIEVLGESIDRRVLSLSDCLNHFVSETFPEGTILRTCGNKIMSGKIILLLAALAALSSAAVALTVAQSELGSFAAARNYPTKADFDRTFSEFADTAPFDSESAAANREKLRAVGLTRINSAQFGEE